MYVHKLGLKERAILQPQVTEIKINMCTCTIVCMIILHPETFTDSENVTLTDAI